MEEKEQEQEHQRQNGKSEFEDQIANGNENEIVMGNNNNNNNESELKQWLTNHIKEISKNDFKYDSAQDPWSIKYKRYPNIKTIIGTMSKWNPIQFKNQMKLNKKLNVNIDNIKGHVKEDNDRIKSCAFGKNDEDKGLCWCKLSKHVVSKHKLSKQTICDDEDNEYDLRENIEKYFIQSIPKISSRNILKKNHRRDFERKKKRFFPTVIPSRSKFNIPKFGYNE